MSDSRRGRRNNTDRETTHREILQAAVEVIARDGPESLNVTEVARRAGVNRGTAYQHFPSREDLLHATAAWVSEQMAEAFYGDMDSLKEEHGAYPPDIATRRLSTFAMDNPELARAWWFDVMSTKGPVTDPFWKRYLAELEEYVAQGYGRKGMDTEVFAFISLVSALLWPIWVDAHSQGRKSREKMRQRFADEMLRLALFGSLEPERHAELVSQFQPEE
jgi:AcrR family transcriptional regulator